VLKFVSYLQMITPTTLGTRWTEEWKEG